MSSVPLSIFKQCKWKHTFTVKMDAWLQLEAAETAKLYFPFNPDLIVVGKAKRRSPEENVI